MSNTTGASQINDWIRDVNRSAVGGGASADYQIRHAGTPRTQSLWACLPSVDPIQLRLNAAPAWPLRRSTQTFYKSTFAMLNWKSASDEPLTKRITITDYPGAAAASDDDDMFANPLPVATRDLLDDLDNLPESEGAAAAGIDV